MVINEKPEIKGGDKVRKAEWIKKKIQKETKQFIFVSVLKLLKNFSAVKKKKEYNKMDGSLVTLHLFFYKLNNYIIQPSGLQCHTEQRYWIREHYHSW